jgi:hypothetical protein
MISVGAAIDVLDTRSSFLFAQSWSFALRSAAVFCSRRAGALCSGPPAFAPVALEDTGFTLINEKESN